MRASDVLHLSIQAIGAQRLRTVLTLIAMSIGVAAVIVLTSLGDSARRYVTSEFVALGTHLLIVLPGRSETTRGHPPLLGETPRDLTLEDAYALLRSPNIVQIAPVSLGSAPVSWGGREREVSVLGSTAELLEVRNLSMAQGRFLPHIDPRRALPVCVLGQKLRDELFGTKHALGKGVRIGDRRFRVIGVLAFEGQNIGIDFDDNIIIPVASAQTLFNSPSLFRVLAQAKTRDAVAAGKQDIHAIIKARHEGEDDVTVIAQDSAVATFDRIFTALTLTVAGIAAISLAVAGVLVMNVMLVTVMQRTAEIGLLKAVGATSRQVQWLFLTEAALLSLLGALLGLALGLASAWALGRMYPVLPIAPPIWSLVGALAVALATGLLFGVLPASRAARLDPVQALSRR
jgi:ABC-type antimicrobial peptide transport system, permease component